ncbi:hypothetical protein Tco_1019962 [Tanacetum coccineum]|uniref:Uncharacterized protein n=1 Tax=Tanacetum coccineum TaxID=301880 RepID=A0ABQ5G0X1_9ASTR
MLEQYSETTLERIELILWGVFEIMMDFIKLKKKIQSDFKSNQQDMEDCYLDIVEACRSFHTRIEDGQSRSICNSRNKESFLSKDYCKECLIYGLEVKEKSWLVQDQTVLGKDYSNLLIADSLLKTIWFINAPCYGNEALASPKANELTIPEQTATGKGTSNPFMADKVADKDGKIIKDQDQDVLECLDTSSKNLRRLT